MWLLFTLAIIGIIIQTLFIIIEHKEKWVPAVILKGSASIVFVILGVITLTHSADLKFARLILIGLCLGACGDILLNLRFVFPKIGSKIFLGGVACFLAGHILYLIALFNYAPDNVYIYLILGVILAGIILTFIFIKLKVKLSYKIFGVLYIGAVSLMFMVALGNTIYLTNTFSLLYAIGAFSFLVSDVVLIFNSFGPKQLFPLRITNLSLYYLGQLLIAISLYFIK